MIGQHIEEHGYTELRVPYLVTRDTLTGTGQLPKFSDESYLSERDDLWLIPTAEVPVTNLHRDEILDGDKLPVKYVAYSPCFRREAAPRGGHSGASSGPSVRQSRAGAVGTAGKWAERSGRDHG